MKVLTMFRIYSIETAFALRFANRKEYIKEIQIQLQMT